MTKRTAEINKKRQKEAPRRKLQRGEGSSSHPPSSSAEMPSVPSLEFTDPTHVARYTDLRTKKFFANSFIDWAVVREFGWEEEVRTMTGVGAWERFFSIREPTYRELTMEFMSTFSLQKGHARWDEANTISFRCCGIQYMMGYTRFSVYIGLYTEEETRTPEYRSLTVALPLGWPRRRVWEAIANDDRYHSGQSKASNLRQPEWRFIHAILARTLSARGHSTGVVNLKDLRYLHSMIYAHPTHIGYALAHFIYHQCTDSRVGFIAIGPYITRLIRGMGILPRPEDMQFVHDMVPMTRDTLIAMGFGPVGAAEVGAADDVEVEDAEDDFYDAEDDAPTPPQHIAEPPTPPSPSVLADLSGKMDRCLEELRDVREMVVDLRDEQRTMFARIFEHLHLTPPPSIPTSHAREQLHTQDEDSLGGQ